MCRFDVFRFREVGFRLAMRPHRLRGLACAPAFVVAMKRCDFIDKAPQRAQEASERE